MSVESITEVIKLWEIGEITMEQCLGKVLVLLLQHDKRLLKVEAGINNPRRNWPDLS